MVVIREEKKGFKKLSHPYQQKKVVVVVVVKQGRQQQMAGTSKADCIPALERSNGGQSGLDISNGSKQWGNVIS